MKPRRWFRCSLITFFLLFTVVSVWLGLQVKWIKNRRQTLDQIRAECSLDLEFSDPSRHPTSEVAPWSIRLLGERGVYGIVVPRGCWNDDPDMLIRKEEELRRLFPEVKHVWLGVH